MIRLLNRKALGLELKCKVILLPPGEELEIGYTFDSIGLDLLESVVTELGLLDRDYYGFKFHNHKQWLDLSKNAAKQIKALETTTLELKFKYYPAEPALLGNESTRYYLYNQLRLDLNEGRLGSESQETLAYLIACILQSELGDFDTKTNSQKNYATEFKFLPDQVENLELAAIKLHQNDEFQGLKSADSELNFLKKSCRLHTYGIDPYPVEEDSTHDRILIGVNHLGISSIQGFIRRNLYEWDEIEKISLERKRVFILCRRSIREKEKVTSGTRPIYGFKFSSREYAYNFWKIVTEHRYFFTLDSTPDLPIVTNIGGLFSKNHKLKFSSRVEKDMLKDHVDKFHSKRVRRSHSLMSKMINQHIKQDPRQKDNLKGSMENIFSASDLNETLPANINSLREEEEENLVEEFNSLTNKDQSQCIEDQGNSIFSADKFRRRSSGGTLTKNWVGKLETFTGRSNCTTITENQESISLEGEDQVNINQSKRQSNDSIRTTLFLISIAIGLILTVLLINDPNHPNSINMLVKKMKLERISLALRENYYLPLRSALRL